MSGELPGGTGDPGPARTDPVTGVHPRALLSTRLDGELDRARRTNRSCSLFLFDVDHFKSVNDAFGHARGDQVLRQVADRVRDLVRESDMLFRYGGDEFVLLLPGLGAAEAVEAATRLAHGVKARPFDGTPPLTVSVSLGVATFPAEADTGAKLMEVADRRNYLAKRRGRGRAVAEDVQTGGVGHAPRLLDREAALATAHEFLARLAGGQPGRLRVTGPAGAGHSRFLAEVATLAASRGFQIISHPTGAAPAGVGGAGVGGAGVGVRTRRGESAGVLLVVDENSDWSQVHREVRTLTAPGRQPRTLGLVHGDPAPPLVDLPVHEVVALTPWSTETLTLWLRAVLQGEPSQALVDWLTVRGGRLPARAERELVLLADSSGLERARNGTWTVSRAALSRRRPPRRRRPAARTDLFGRDREITQVSELTTTRRLITLVGPDGTGKTQLALAVADQMACAFDEGAVYVELTEADTARQVAAAIARALDVTEPPGTPLADTVVAHLAERSLLIVLDDVTRPQPAVPVVAQLLAAVPTVTILATSRERLRISGEQVYPVAPLGLPDLDRLPTTAEQVAEAVAASPALALLLTRAQEAARGFTSTPERVATLARLCHRLGGQPLPIELVAARCDRLSPEELLAALNPRGNAPGEPPASAGVSAATAARATLHAVLDWTTALLTAEEMDLLIRLAVFVGGCAPAAVAAVCPAEDDPHPSWPLTAVLASRLVRTHVETGDTRVALPGPVRDYLAERFARHPNAAAVRQRHATYYADLAEPVDGGYPGVDAGPAPDEEAPPSWVAQIDAEYGNLRAALDWALTSGDTTLAATIAVSLTGYWRTGRDTDEGRDRLERLHRGPTLAPGPRARVLGCAAGLAATQGDLAAAAPLAEASLALARTLGEPGLLAWALHELGSVAERRGDEETARACHTEQLARERERGHRPGVAAALGRLADLARRGGDRTSAEELAESRLALEREIGEPNRVADALRFTAGLRRARADLAGAGTLLAEALRIARRGHGFLLEADLSALLGDVARQAGDPVQAYWMYSAAVSLRHRHGAWVGLRESLTTLAGLVAPVDPQHAARLLGAAEGLRARTELSARPGPDRRAGPIAALVEKRLGVERAAEMWAAGRAAAIESVVADAVSLDPTVLTDHPLSAAV